MAISFHLDKLRVNTVDGFQGMERDRVLVSCTRFNARNEDMIMIDWVTYNAEYHYFRISIVSSNTTSVSVTASYQNFWEVETVLNFKYSSPTVSDLPDIPMHILNSPTIISCSLILRRSSCKAHRFSPRFRFSLSFLL